MKSSLYVAAFLLGLLAASPQTPVLRTSLQQNVPPVVINEVAWAGTAASSADEFIELKNNTSQDIDLSKWTLSWGDEDDRRVIHFVTGQEKSNTREVRSSFLPARGLYLLERSDDNTISDIQADLIFTGALRNEGEVLELRNGSGELVDTANISGAEWPAGASSSGVVPFASMERINPLSRDEDTNWASNNGVLRNGRDADGNLINATPRAENSRKNTN